MKKQVMKALTGLVVLSLAVAQPVVALADEPTNVEEQGGKATTTYVAWIGEQGYESLEEAVANSKSGDTITLGEGTYTLYNKVVDGKTIDQYVVDKELTFVGTGTDKTTWRIGPTEYDSSVSDSQQHSDSSLKGSKKITFKDMTLDSTYEMAHAEDYYGFSHTNETVVENCVINGHTRYWGYESAKFYNTTFNAPSNGGYMIWTYSSPVMTFEKCTFVGAGKAIKVYTDYSAGKHDIVINYKDCTVNASKANKNALTIDDHNMGNYKYIINIEGNNEVTGMNTNAVTCSKLFGFGDAKSNQTKEANIADNYASNNTNRTIVKINGETVWGPDASDGATKGKMVSHEIQAAKYSDGFMDKDTAYTEKGTFSYENSNGMDNGKRTGTKWFECNYCEWISNKENVTEYELIYNSNGGTEKNSGSETNAIAFASEDDNSVEKSYWESENATVSLQNNLYEKSGCEFLGWGYNARGKNSEGEDEYVGSTLEMNQAYEVYAQWGHTISYDANGGSGSIENTKAKENSKVNVESGSRFSRSGYSFTGWNTQADGNGTAYQAGAEVELSSNITLYAQWKASSTSNTTPSGDSTPSTPSPSESSTPATEQTQTSTQSVLGATRPAETVAVQPAETVVTQSTETVTEETSAVLGATRDENTEDAVLGQSRGAGTGDESHMAVWGGAAAGALALLALYFGRKNRKNRRF